MSTILSTLFQNTSGALRTKSGTTSGIRPADYPIKITELPSGGFDPVNAQEVNYIAGETQGFEGIQAGMFIKLESGGGAAYNLAEEIGECYIQDTALLYSDSEVSREELLVIVNNDGNYIYKLILLEVSGGQYSVLDQYTIPGDYVPIRIAPMGEDRFVLHSIEVVSGGDNSNNSIRVYTVNNGAITLAYTKNIDIKSISPGYTYNNHSDYNIFVQYREASETYDESTYYVMFTYSSSGSSQDPDDRFLSLVSVPIADDNTESSIVSQKLNITSFNITKGWAFCGATYVGNMRTLWPIIDDSNNLYIGGVYCNPYNVFRIYKNTTDLVVNQFAQIFMIENVPYLIYDDNENHLYYSKLTVNTTAKSGAIVTLGESNLLYESNEGFHNYSIPVLEQVYENKAILTLRYEDSNSETNTETISMNYLEVTKNDDDSLTAGTLVTLGKTSVDNGDLFNSIHYLSDGSLLTCFGSGNNASVETCNSSGGGIEPGGMFVAYPAVNSIDGIAKTSAATGSMGIAYVLDTSDYPEPPVEVDFNLIVGGDERIDSITEADLENGVIEYIETIDPEAFSQIFYYMSDSLYDNNWHSYVINGTNASLTGEIKQICNNCVYMSNTYDNETYSITLITEVDTEAMETRLIIESAQDFPVDFNNIVFNQDKDLEVADGLYTNDFTEFLESIDSDVHRMVAEYTAESLVIDNSYAGIIRSTADEPRIFMFTPKSNLSYRIDGIEGAYFDVTLSIDEGTGDTSVLVTKTELPK